MNVGANQHAVSLDLVDVSKHYGSFRALNSVSLNVQAGELLTILGPSGSGKTTLLKVVSGFEVPEEGSVMVGDRDVTEVAPAKRNIGMVFQNYALFPHMKVSENVAFPLEMRRYSKQEIRDRVSWALRTVELGRYGDRLPSQLSGGQQQRVALARAIVFNPSILLLDEPFGALDRKLRETMQLEVKHLQRKLGLTTLFITHDQEEALVLSDRIAVMNEGRIEQLAPPVDIYEHPANPFVAEFIGESNLFHVIVKERKSSQSFIEIPGGITFVSNNGGDLKPGDKIGVMIRPERLRFSSNSAALPENSIQGKVKEVIYLGTSFKYRIQVSEETEILVRAASGSETQVPVAGDHFNAVVQPGDIHLIQ